MDALDWVLLSLALTEAATLMVIVGVTYGVMRTRVGGLESDLRAAERSLQKHLDESDLIRERLAVIETKLDMIMQAQGVGREF